MTARTHRLLLPISGLALIALAGCSDDHGRAVPPAPTVEVDALDNRFEAPTLTIEAGTTVRFVNKGRNDHDVLPAEGNSWGVLKDQFGPTAEYSYAFDTPGTYPYYCSIHGVIKDGRAIGMVGMIEVSAS